MSDETPTTPATPAAEAEPTVRTPAAPAAPAAATGPAAPAGPTAPARPVASSEEYFNSSRLKVIGTILAGSVAVGALGGIAGVAFDPDPIKPGNVVQPGNGSASDTRFSSFGNSAPHTVSGDLLPGAGSHRLTANLPSAAITISPSPVDTGSTLPSPSEVGSDAATPSPTPGGDTSTGDGSGVTLAASGVQVFIPSGWNVDNQEDSDVYFSDGNGSFAFAATVQVDASTAAGDLLQENLDGLLPGDTYTQLQTSDIQTLDPFGSVVSAAAIEYQALVADNQGSVSDHGQIYTAVRQDGTALVVLIEHLPADDWETAFETEKDIVNNTFNAFAGS